MTPIEWLSGKDTGLSSKTILAVMTGIKTKGNFHQDIPRDPSDFGKCHRLLQLFPEWKDRLQEVGEVYPKWRPLIDVWGDLTDLYANGEIPELRKTMQDLMETCTIEDGCVLAG